MYYPVGWPKILSAVDIEDGNPVRILKHPRKELIIVIRERCISLWHSRLCSLVHCHKQNEAALQKNGFNTGGLTSADGTILVVTTSKGNLLFLKLHIGEYSYHDMSLPLKKILYYRHDSTNVRSMLNILTATIEPFYQTAVVGGVTSLTTVHDCIMVSTGYGVLHRVLWDGQFNSHLTVKLQSIHFSADLTPKSKGQLIGEDDVYAKEVICSRELCGLILVLSNGRAAFVASQSAHYEPSSLHGVWINCVDNATCASVNVKYKMAAFGRTCGAVTVASADEVTGAWSVNHVLKLSSQQVADECHIGPVECMEWSQDDNMVIAVAWLHGGLSVWSVYGVLLYYSHGDQPGTPSPFSGTRCKVGSLCWSSDGYHLWMLRRASDGSHDTDNADHMTQEQDDDRTANNQDGHPPPNNSKKDSNMEILVMQFLKNSIVNNPIVHTFCFLVRILRIMDGDPLTSSANMMFIKCSTYTGCDKLFIRSGAQKLSHPISNHHHLFLQGPDRLYLHGRRGMVCNGDGSKSVISSGPQWRVVQLPFSYLCANWPLQHAALDNRGRYIAVSGTAGFALYLTSKRKWRLFGNELQEQSIVCRGGLAWWEHFVIFPCTSQGKNYEVCFYSIRSNLDHSQLVNVITVPSPVVKLNVAANCLLLVTKDCVLRFYSLEMIKSNVYTDHSKGSPFKINKLQQMSLSRHVYNLRSLVSVIPSSLCAESGSHDFVDGYDHLDQPVSIMINVSGKLLMIQQDRSASVEKSKSVKVKYSSPVCLATAVEALWTPPIGLTASSSHLVESLWLGCGSNGVKVWLPLYPKDEGHPNFLSKRIMLTLHINIYTQAVMFKEAILLGVSHETAYHNVHFTANRSFPFATVEKTTQIYLHHILRQLLRRNLGSHAFQIAQSCSHLPYFAHVLELMLHEILEEEAPVALSIPDALLPRVVEFIKQFAEYPDTIGSCTRKTEVALWQYLFAAVGSPRDLFETCIQNGKLQTAATYLIIIQNLETPVVGKQLATRLLETALEQSSWQLCKDLVRFLKAIGSGDSPMATPLGQPTNSNSPKASPSVSDEHKVNRPQFVLDLTSKEEYFIDLILSRHARKLLLSCKLQDLGRFASHLSFNLAAWLCRERYRAACIDEYVSTLCKLHTELQVPFPVNTTRRHSKFSSTKHHGSHSTTNSSDEISGGLMKSHNETDYGDSSLSTSNLDRPSSSMQRANRPPDLDLSTTQSSLHSTMTEKLKMPKHASTPEKFLANQTQDVSLSIRPIGYSSADSTGNYSESEWESDDSFSHMIPPVSSSRKIPHQTEKEIRYFVEVFLDGYGLEWALLLGILLLDSSVINQVLLKMPSMPPPSLQRDVAARMLQGLNLLLTWAVEESNGYIQFLEVTLSSGHELNAIVASTPTPPATTKSFDETDIPTDTATLPDHTPHPCDSSTTPKATESNNMNYCSVS